MDGRMYCMPQSNAVREWVRRARADEHMDLRELDAIADRIDREMVELPRDADGEPIHLGETAYATDDPSIECVVSNIDLFLNGEISIGLESRGIYTYRNPSRLSRERQDSWERIADDVETLVWLDDKDEERSRRELAARIRRMALKEGGSDD